VSLRNDDDEGLSGTFSRALAALLTGLDGIDANRDVAVVATSSVPPGELQPAIVRPGRLESWIELR
jgi:ATP-dependent 26S proteasome regulatory subunit